MSIICNILVSRFVLYKYAKSFIVIKFRNIVNRIIIFLQSIEGTALVYWIRALDFPKSSRFESRKGHL